MLRYLKGALVPAAKLVLFVTVCTGSCFGQSRSLVTSEQVAPLAPAAIATLPSDREYPLSVVEIDPDSGHTARELVLRALDANAELAAARLDIDRARARLGQAGLRPNPTLEFEHGSGQIVGNPGERETSVGISIPLEVAGQRGRRIDFAEAELAAAEAQLADRERRLAAEVSNAFVEALAAARDVETYGRLLALDVESSRVVEARIAEGESAPLELSLIRVEGDRLRSEAILAEGRLRAAMLRVRLLIGARPEERLQLRQDLSPMATPVTPDAVPSRDDAIAAALLRRPDLQFARLSVAVTRAGLRLAEARGKPDLSLIGRFTTGSSLTDLPAPFSPVPDRERRLAIGISLSLPVFDRNQGAVADAALAVTQAERLVAFAESAVRADVEAAYGRFEAARSVVEIYERSLLVGSNRNVATVREAYQLGVYRVTDLIAEQRRFADVERDYTAALAAARQAFTDLQTAIGAPLVETVPQKKDETHDR